MIPLFKSHYSIGKSILTLEKAGKTDPLYPASIIDIAKENELKQVVLIEDNFTGFLEGYSNLKDVGAQLIFGIKFTFTEDINDKTEESLKTNHKLIVLAKNYAGYQKLIKLYTKAATDGFYYTPRLDFKILKSFFDESLDIWVPFYDSFIYNNLLTNSICVPEFDAPPVYLIEKNLLPIDSLLEQYIQQNNYTTSLVKSIYYKNKCDFKKYVTRRCIEERTTLDKPELDGLSSNEFCFESWKDYINNVKN